MMICQNCGTQNADNSKFCIKCGMPINVNNVQNDNKPINVQQESSMNVTQQQPMNINVGINNISQNTNHAIDKTIKNEDVKIRFVEYFLIILAILLKPFTAIGDKINKFNGFKNSAILSLIVSLIAMFIVFIKTIISTVRVTTGGFFSEPKTEWIWENLKDIDFIKIIGTNLLVFLGIIFAIACVYYIAGLIVKKQSNFSRLLGISAISVVPMLLCALLLSPLFTMIYAPLGMVITIIGAVYTLIIIYETINNEISLEGNAKYYFNLICLSILLIAGYYVYMKFFMASVGDLSDIFDMFG